MKRIIFMFALVLGLSACDNTKLKLHAPQSDQSSEKAVLAGADSLKSDTLVADSAHTAGKKVIRISTM
jgi:hypothetical protein